MFLPFPLSSCQKGSCPFQRQSDRLIHWNTVASDYLHRLRNVPSGALLGRLHAFDGAHNLHLFRWHVEDNVALRSRLVLKLWFGRVEISYRVLTVTEFGIWSVVREAVSTASAYHFSLFFEVDYSHFTSDLTMSVLHIPCRLDSYVSVHAATCTPLRCAFLISITSAHLIDVRCLNQNILRNDRVCDPSSRLVRMPKHWCVARGTPLVVVSSP